MKYSNPLHYFVEPRLTLVERVAFYGVWILTGLVWLLHFEKQQTPLIFQLAQITVVFLAGGALALLFSRLDLSENFKRLEVLLPATISLIWFCGILGAPKLDASTSFVFALLSLLNCLLARPFGLVIWLSASAPVILAINLIVYQSLSPSPGAVMTLMNLLFLGLGMTLGLARPSAWRASKRGQLNEGLEQELAQVQYEKNRLKNTLVNTERELEQKIRKRTEALQTANSQLNQQVALRKSVSEALVKSQARLTQAIEASSLGLFDWEVAQGKYYQSNFHHIFGEKELSSQDIIECLKRIVHPEDYDHVRDTLNACLRGDESSYELSYRVQDGELWRWIEENGRVQGLDENGHANRIIGTRRDIHNDIQRNEEIRLAKSVFDHTSEGVFVLDQHHRFLSVNPAYTRITGHELQTILGRTLESVSETPQADQIYPEIFASLLKDGKWQGELLEKRRHGDYFSQRIQINVIKDETGAIKYFAGLMSDVTDSKHVDEKMDYLLNYDALTKLANRVQFQNQLHRALVRFQEEGVPFALVLIDIDRFKHFNDSFGYDASDGILRAVAERLSNNVQDVDVLARIGGNEFACIVACSPTFQVQKFAERLFHSISERPYAVGNDEVVLSCSVGIALVPDHTESIETLTGYGALAVQKAKYNGGSQILMFDESLKSFSRERLDIEKELRSALINDELEVYYQPKLDLKRGLILSYEALIRWKHPERGLVSPQEFVAIAEETGLISDLGAFVLYAACKQTRVWQEMGFGDLSVSVNLSPRQLLEPHLKSIIAESLRESELSPGNLELELTETALKEGLAGVSARLSDLKSLGIKVSIDDFGTGYSSLSYLKHLPVDTLKVDREFIKNIEDSKEQQAITKAIIVLGNSLDLKVVAEGAENERQQDILAALGCDYLQGYIVSRPLSREDMQALLEGQTK